MAVDPASVYQVVAQSAVESLGDELQTIGIDASNAVATANSHWKNLTDWFQVTGAEGVYQMLERPAADALALSEALMEARQQIVLTAPVFGTLQTKREELLNRIDEVNAALSAASASVTSTSSALTYGDFESGSSTETEAQRKADAAEAALSAQQEEARRLREDITRFNADVISAEDELASALGRVSGGTDVYRVDGKPMSSELTQWGVYGSDMDDIPMSERLRKALTDEVERRLDWFVAEGRSSKEISDWIAAHSGFIAAVGLADPARVSRWFEGVAGTEFPSGWEPTGELAVLMAAAPGVIGNLNGIPARVKDTDNYRYLQQLLDQDDLDGGTRDRLEQVYNALVDDNGKRRGDVFLLSLFQDLNEPRAAVSYGDIDRADLVLTLTHGIRTDLEQFGDWSGTGRDVQREVSTELERRGYTSADGRISIASVVWFEYDSKGATAVQGSIHAEAGAARYAQFVGGVSQRNPDSITAGWFHSYGTTMGAQAQGRHPELLDQIYTVGSAGWTEDAAAAIGQQNVEVNSTAAGRDWTAWAGRSPGISSHPVNPIDLDYVTELSSETGTVDFGIGADGKVRAPQGEQTEGHGSHHHTPWYEFWRGQRGYLDTDARSFLEGVDQAADLLKETK